MDKIELSDVKNLVDYEKTRQTARARVIALKKRRRVALGENITLLFENRETVLFQIQEMIRTERLVDDHRIQEEIDAYNELIPGQGELSATLFIEIPELVRMSPEEVRRALNRFQGLDVEGVALHVAGARIPALCEQGHSKEEKMAAVHYLRFALPAAAIEALHKGAPARLIVDHPGYKAEADLSADVLAELRGDLALSSDLTPL